MQVNRSKSIYDSLPLAILLVLTFVTPDWLEKIKVFQVIDEYFGLLCLALLLILSMSERKVHMSTVLIWAFCGTLLLSTIVGSRHILTCLTSFSEPIGMCLMIDLWIRRNPRVLLRALESLDIYIYINLLTILLFPDGITERTWFLGFKNLQFRIFLQILAISLVCSY